MNLPSRFQQLLQRARAIAGAPRPPAPEPARDTAQSPGLATVVERWSAFLGVQSPSDLLDRAKRAAVIRSDTAKQAAGAAASRAMAEAKATFAPAVSRASQSAVEAAAALAPAAGRLVRAEAAAAAESARAGARALYWKGAALFLGGIFVFGIANALPGAVSSHLLERERMQREEEAKGAHPPAPLFSSPSVWPLLHAPSWLPARAPPSGDNAELQ